MPPFYFSLFLYLWVNRTLTQITKLVLLFLFEELEILFF